MKTQALCQTKNKNQNGVCRAWTKMEGGEISKGIFAIPPFRARNRFYGEGGISTAQIKKYSTSGFFGNISGWYNSLYQPEIKSCGFYSSWIVSQGKPFGIPKISFPIQNRIEKRFKSKSFFSRIASHNSKKGLDCRPIFSKKSLKSSKILTKKLKSWCFFGLKTIQKVTGKIQVGIVNPTNYFQKLRNKFPIFIKKTSKYIRKLSGKSSNKELFITKRSIYKIQK